MLQVMAIRGDPTKFEVTARVARDVVVFILLEKMEMKMNTRHVVVGLVSMWWIDATCLFSIGQFQK